MRRSFLSLAVAAAAAAAASASAQPPQAFTGNVGLFTDYRFRGLSQTFQRPALQGGFDYSHASGFYLGNWNSNVSSSLYPNANLEMDLYGGYKQAFGDFGLDLGAIYYGYPGSEPKIDNTELYLGGSWKWLSVKYFHAVSDFFSVPDTKNSWYLDGAAIFDLGNGWGVIGHLGRQKVKNLGDASYTDWRLGVTKDLEGFVLGAAYVDTNAKDSVYRLSDARKTINIGKSGLVFSVSKTF